MSRSEHRTIVGVVEQGVSSCENDIGKGNHLPEACCVM